METRLPSRFGKVVAAVFTSLVAPVLVNLAVKETTDKPAKPEHVEPVSMRQLATPQPGYPSELSPTGRSLSPNPEVFAAAQSVQTARIMVRGVGPTSEQALQNALYNALRQALASAVDSQNWARNSPALCERMLRDSGELIVGWQQLGLHKEWGQNGLIYHSTAAVEVNLTALADRLRTTSTPGWCNPYLTMPYQPASPHSRIQ